MHHVLPKCPSSIVVSDTKTAAFGFLEEKQQNHTSLSTRTASQPCEAQHSIGITHKSMPKGGLLLTLLLKHLRYSQQKFSEPGSCSPYTTMYIFESQVHSFSPNLSSAQKHFFLKKEASSRFEGKKKKKRIISQELLSKVGLNLYHKGKFVLRQHIGAHSIPLFKTNLSMQIDLGWGKRKHKKGPFLSENCFILTTEPIVASLPYCWHKG